VRSVASVIRAGAGNDEVILLSGDNWVQGGPGRDVLLGGSGRDTLFGEGGNDLLAGGLGDDYLDSGPGNDILFEGDAWIRPSVPEVSVTWAELLASYVPSRRSSLVYITGWIEVAPDPAGTDSLVGGSGTDWFWTEDPTEAKDARSGEPRNAAS
jgi:Ca2+-binding RTX toxin-like protein